MTGYREKTIDIFPGRAGADAISLGLIEESPLAIRIQGNPHTVVMRTPGDELAQAAGYCLAEGIVDHPDDIVNLACCGEDVNVVTVTLSQQRLAAHPNLLKPRPHISQTSCGICGKELVSDLVREIRPVDRKDTPLDPAVGRDCLNRLRDLQTRHHSSHAAALFTANGDLLALGEDVGRHNALDKAIGKLFLSGELSSAALAVLSSRISYELVQKAGRAGIPAIFSKSGPTALAVEMAERLDMTLACPAKTFDLFVFCGGHGLAGYSTRRIKS